VTLLRSARSSKLFDVKTRLLWLVALCSALLACVSSMAQTPRSQIRLRWIILRTQHLGAHGMGYNTESINQLSRRLRPSDIPVLISLAGRTSDVMVGAEFAIASQCEAALVPVREAAVEHKIDFMTATEIMDHMAHFEGCDAETRRNATKVRGAVEELYNADNARIQRELGEKAEEDARIQRNGLKLLDAEQAKTLTREERLEVYRRSLAAMGLRENGPMTPDQRQLADRMYRSMVLDEVKTSPNQ
jgi:hypothetical protein